jgi:hypothetical protein
MFVVAMCGLASLILFCYALTLIVRADQKPPLDIRTESRRSQAEYAFNRAAAALRRQGRFFMLAAGITLAICVVFGLFSAMDDSGN